MSWMTIEALRALNYLENQKISCELIDLRSIRPIDWETLFTSIKKTGRLLVLDTGATTGSIAAEIVARVAMEKFNKLLSAPLRIACPDVPTPTSFGLTKSFYPNSTNIIEGVGKLLGKSFSTKDLENSSTPHDVPGDWFKGPF